MKISNLLIAAAVTGILSGAGATFQRAAAAVADATADGAEKHACAGLNSCKGKGGCKTEKHECKAHNECKGQGGCATAKHECKGKNDCKQQGKGGANECKGKGGCKVGK